MPRLSSPQGRHSLLSPGCRGAMAVGIPRRMGKAKALNLPLLCSGGVRPGCAELPRSRSSVSTSAVAHRSVPSSPLPKPLPHMDRVSSDLSAFPLRTTVVFTHPSHQSPSFLTENKGKESCFPLSQYPRGPPGLLLEMALFPVLVSPLGSPLGQPCVSAMQRPRHGGMSPASWPSHGAAVAATAPVPREQP